MKSVARARLPRIAPIQADNIVVLVLNPDPAHEPQTLRLRAGHHVKDQRAHLSEELLAERPQFVMLCVKVAAQEHQGHEALRQVLHAEHAAKVGKQIGEEPSLPLLVRVVVRHVADALLAEHHSAQKVMVVQRHHAQVLIGLQILNVSLHQRGVAAHGLDQLGFLGEDAGCHCVGLARLVSSIGYRAVWNCRGAGHRKSHGRQKPHKSLSETHNSSKVRRPYYSANSKTMCTKAVESKGCPSRLAGRNLIWAAALCAASSSPCPNPRTTRMSCSRPLAENV